LFVCAETVELGLPVPAPETVVLVTLRSALAAAALPELPEFSWLAPEVESASDSAEAIAQFMPLIRSAVVVKHTAANRWPRVTIMNVSSQRSFGVSC